MRAYEFVIEGRPLTPQEKKDFQSQADYGGEDPDAPADKYGVQSNQTKQALGRGTTSIGGVDIPDDAWSAGIGSSAAMGSLAGIKSASAPTAKQTTAPSTKAPTTAPSTPTEPTIQNKIATPPEKSNILTGRAPSRPEDITHAYRNMSQAELQHAQANGAFLPNPNPGRTPGWKPYEKWWSPGDAQGTFDRARNRIGAGTKVRVPIDKVPSNSPVNASHAEVLNKETGEWLPVIQP